MANVTVANLTSFASNERFYGFWKLTRALLASGWKYRASSDAVVKESGTANPDLDRWAVGGHINLTTVQNNTNLSVTALVSGEATITATGATFSSTLSVGRALVISGAASAGNNGTFRISSYVSATSVKIFNPAAVSGDANNGAITWAEKQGGSALAVSSILNGVATLTGLTGLVVPSGAAQGSEGHTLAISGAANSGNNGVFQINSVISTTSCTILNAAAVAGDTSVTWTECDPISMVYPTTMRGATGVGSWIVLQGPSTLKIAVGANVSTGTFIRGEKITQASTGAEGELLGLVTDVAGGGGYMVVAPRLNGSGGATRGWSATGSITAQTAPTGSGASITPTGVQEFVREMVWWKNTATNGHMYYQVIESVVEGTTTATTGRFSTMAALATATTTICPGGATGGSPLTNGFPTVGTMVMIGTAGIGNPATSSADWFCHTQSLGAGNFQIMVANAFEGTGKSPDGTWTLAAGVPALSAATFIGMGFTRLDDTEDGDVDPYVFFLPSSGAYLRSRTAYTTSGGDANTSGVWRTAYLTTSAITCFSGFRRRGYYVGLVANEDAFQEFDGFMIGYFAVPTTAVSPLCLNVADAEKVACSIDTVRVREPVMVASTQVGSSYSQKMMKGTTRWWYMVQGGAGTDTYDGKRWVQLATDSAPTTSTAIIAGPWDQSTAPTNT